MLQVPFCVSFAWPSTDTLHYATMIQSWHLSFSGNQFVIWTLIAAVSNMTCKILKALIWAWSWWQQQWFSPSQQQFQVLWQLAQHDGWSIAGKLGDDDLQGQMSHCLLLECYISSLPAVRTKQTIFFFVRGNNNQPAVMAMAMARTTSGDKKTGKCIL